MRIESNVYQPATAKAIENPAGQEPQLPTDQLLAAEKKQKAQDALRQKQEESAELLTMLRQQMIAMNEQTERANEADEIQLKCYKIAERILAGDKVPAADMQYLVKNDPGLYGRSIMLKLSKEHPQKHKRLTDDEDLRTRPSFVAALIEEQANAAGQDFPGSILDTKA